MHIASIHTTRVLSVFQSQMLQRILDVLFNGPVFSIDLNIARR